MGSRAFLEIAVQHLVEIRPGSESSSPAPVMVITRTASSSAARCRGVQIVERRQRDGVVLVGPIDGDQRHRTLNLVENVLVTQLLNRSLRSIEAGAQAFLQLLVDSVLPLLP